MNLRSILRATLMAMALAAPALAQQPAPPSASAKAKPAAPAAAVQPALAQLVAPRAGELGGAGIFKILARTGKQRRDIEILTKWGAAYFPWPKDTKPVTFEMEIGAGNTVTVRADGYSEAGRASYAAAFDAVIPRAVRLANDLKTRAERPRP